MIEKWVTRGAGGLAIIGGIILLGLSMLTVVSVIGRALPRGQGVTGDFELIEMGAAISVFLFLPWCQLRRGQVSVDILSERLGARVHAFLGLLGNLVLSAVAVVLLWRFWLGFGEKFPLGSDGLRSALALGDPPYFTETTFDLLIPVWIPHALCLPGLVWLVITSAFTVWRSAQWLRAGGEP